MYVCFFVYIVLINKIKENKNKQLGLNDMKGHCLIINIQCYLKDYLSLLSSEKNAW